tara:strand:+ start:227 stop:856 length:630 start_codon:yes stop_codon:yes gene_type:complete
MNKDIINVIKPFGPAIGHIKIPLEIINKLNNYIDKIILDHKKNKNLDHGPMLVGNVSNEFKLEKQILNESGWGSFLANSTGKWIELIENKRINKFQIINSWIVRQFKNEYNPVHQHGGHISGVGYLKVPRTFGNTIQKNKLNNNGCLELISGQRAFLQRTTLTIKPAVGDFYLFPHYLSHCVYPFSETDEERRSISFNAVIDDNIYNLI